MYLFLDTETHAEVDPIMIQLAYRASDSDTYFDALYGTGGEPISLMAMAVHHITEADIAGKPRFEDTPDVSTLQSLLLDGPLVAHNVAFDQNVLERHGMEVPRSICTLRLSRYLFPELEQHKLQYLRYYFDLQFETRPVVHDALGDVIVLEGVFWKLYETLKERAGITEDADMMERMIDISSRPSVLYMCKFGKHKGTLWSEVPQSYLNWIVNMSDFTDEDVIYTAQYYLEEESE